MNKWIELLLGLILIVGAILVAFASTAWGSLWNFKHAAWEFLKGGLFWFVFLIGLLFIMLGISDLKE
jgi:amino acid permease